MKKRVGIIILGLSLMLSSIVTVYADGTVGTGPLPKIPGPGPLSITFICCELNE